MRTSELALAIAGALMLQACAPRPVTLAEVVSTVQNSMAAQKLVARPGHALEHASSVENSALRTEKFRHTVHGIEVLGSGVAYHESRRNRAVRDEIAEFHLETRPRLLPSEALALASSMEGSLPATEPRLKILPTHGSARLLYSIEMESGADVWLDAHSGQHVATTQNQETWDTPVRSARGQGFRVESLCRLFSFSSNEMEIFPKEECHHRLTSACQVLGSFNEPLRFAPMSCSQADLFTDESAQRAESNSRRFLEYFSKVHGRNGFDDRGSPILSLVHAGERLSNAFWSRSGKFIAYGDGDGRVTRDFTFATDVAGHELTHAVIQHSAALLGWGDAGALGESLADYFGKMIEDGNDWRIGAQMLLSPDFLFLRNLRAPETEFGHSISPGEGAPLLPYPSSLKGKAPVVEPCTHANDSCAIHFNATIPGHAWYLIHEKIGRAKTEALLYLSLTQFFTAVSDFGSAARQVLAACRYSNYTESECQSVHQAVSVTGMLSGP